MTETVNRDAIMAALGKVQEPELHKDLVTLNMIRDLVIEDGKDNRQRQCNFASRRRDAK